METAEQLPADDNAPAPVAGCVESFADGLVTGWAFDRSGTPLQLELVLGGHRIALQHQSMPRGDVAAVLGDAAAQAGFRALLSDEGRDRLREAFTLALDIFVVANGVRLGTALRDAAATLAAPPAVDQPPVRGHVDQCDCFRLRGWATEGGLASHVELRCNGKPVTATLVRETRPDVLDEDGQRIADAGFVIDIPASLWRELPNDGDGLLEIHGGSYKLPGASMVLDRGTVRQWIARVLEIPDTPDRAPLLMLALEHVRAAALAPALSAQEPLWASLLAAAGKLGIEAGQLHQPSTASGNAAESLDNLLLWDAMRLLNARLAGRREGAADAIIEAYRSAPLTPAAREWYANLAIQVACDTGELDRVREITDFGRFAEMAQCDDVSALCLAIAVLARDGRIAQATDAMNRLAGVRGGWLQTTCLRHAIRDVLAAEREGRIDGAAAEQFRLAFLALLGAISGDWFSRLYDLALVEATAEMVMARDQYSDAHHDEVQARAVQFFGLCPPFWELLDTRRQQPVTGLLAEASAHWQACRDGLHAMPTAIPDIRALAALQWFQTAGNAEACTVLREVACNLGNQGLDAGEATKRLLAASPQDRLRLMALPAPAHMPPGEHGEPAIDLIRRQSGCSTSGLARLQRACVSALLALRHADSQAAETIDALLASAVGNATLLGGARALHLGCDLLAALATAPSLAGRGRPRLMATLRTQLLAAVQDTTRAGPVPAPVFAAVARLQSVASDRLAEAVLGEVRAALLQRQPAWLPAETAASPGSTPACWPSDTLVLVNITDAPEAEFIPRIRSSWANDLAALGISTRYVRQDLAAGALHADDEIVFADGNPSALLTMLQHSLGTSAANYFVVLPARAYLSVTRFIESAAYRKHHFYGSLLTRADITARLALRDGEEPGPFTPARIDAAAPVIDHECGFSVSRAALLQTTAAAETWRGKRLLATSRDDGELLSDLLALNGIRPSDEDFHCHLRLTTAGSTPVAQRQNAFLPGPDTPTVLTTAGDDDDFARVLAAASASGLQPRKIWPSTQIPRLGRNTNQLELLSPVASLQGLHRAEVTVVAVMRNEMLLLPHFLAHYRKLGAGAFVVVDNLSDDGSREYLLAQPDVIVYSADTEYRHSHYGVTWQHTVLANHCLGKWVLLADADEFLSYENSESVPLPQFTREIHAEGADAALVRMIDMYPFGDLEDADFTRDTPFTAAPWFDREPLIELMFGGGQFSNSRNFVNGLRHRIAPSRINAYVSQKYALFRYMPWMRISEGVHYTANMHVSGRPAFFAHFKYHAGFKAKVLTEVKRKQHYNGAEEYKRYAAMLAEGSGAFGDGALSVRYGGSADFMAVAAKSDSALRSGGRT
jgi:hypothetical protein